MIIIHRNGKLIDPDAIKGSKDIKEFCCGCWRLTRDNGSVTWHLCKEHEDMLNGALKIFSLQKEVEQELGG